MNPLSFFFKLGDKATGGDPYKQADFIYYMLWIIFIAFVTLLISNVYKLITLPFDGDYITWSLVGFAISAIQYFSLKQAYEAKKLRDNPKEDKPIESVEDMLKEFDEKEVEDGITKEEKRRESKSTKRTKG